MKYIIRVMLSVVAAGLAGCNWFDVGPRTEVRADDMFESEAGFWQALTGLYIGMGQQSAYGANLTWDAIEFMAWEHANTSAAGSWYQLQRGDYKATRSALFIEQAWSKLYNVIVEANYLLYALEEYGDILDRDTRRTIEGEALALRAYCHFDLIRLFAEGNLAADKSALDKPCIPYVTQYSKHVAPQKSYRETIALLMDDIDRAIACLDETQLPASQQRFSGYSNMTHRAAMLLRARVALWADDPRTLDYALDLIEVLEAAPSMWAIDMGQGNNGGAMVGELLFYVNPWKMKDYMEYSYRTHVAGVRNQNMLIMQDTDDSGANLVKDDVFQLGRLPEGVAESDLRYKNWFVRYDNNDAADRVRGYLTVKVLNEGANASSIAPLMRVSEVYLIAAERWAATDRAKAVECLNFLRRQRNNPPDYMLPDDVSAEELMEIIQREYRREFAQEGQIFFFYKRNGVVRIPGSRGGDMTAEKYKLPYPDTEYEFGRV